MVSAKALVAVLAIGVGAGLYWHRTADESSAARKRFARPEAPKKPATAPRPHYAYSVVPGGVYNGEEVRDAMRGDGVVAGHYRGIRPDNLRTVTARSPKLVHVSYRKGNSVYWTKKKVTVTPGEKLLTDGKEEIRARCGNRISEEARKPTHPDEPSEEAMGLAAHPPVVINLQPPAPGPAPPGVGEEIAEEGAEKMGRIVAALPGWDERNGGVVVSSPGIVGVIGGGGGGGGGGQPGTPGLPNTPSTPGTPETPAPPATPGEPGGPGPFDPPQTPPPVVPPIVPPDRPVPPSYPPGKGTPILPPRDPDYPPPGNPPPGNPPPGNPPPRDPPPGNPPPGNPPPGDPPPGNPPPGDPPPRDPPPGDPPWKPPKDWTPDGDDPPTPVPEPSTYAMMLGGLLLVAFGLWRRRGEGSAGGRGQDQN